MVVSSGSNITVVSSSMELAVRCLSNVTVCLFPRGNSNTRVNIWRQCLNVSLYIYSTASELLSAEMLQRVSLYYPAHKLGVRRAVCTEMHQPWMVKPHCGLVIPVCRPMHRLVWPPPANPFTFLWHYWLSLLWTCYIKEFSPVLSRVQTRVWEGMRAWMWVIVHECEWLWVKVSVGEQYKRGNEKDSRVVQSLFLLVDNLEIWNSFWGSGKLPFWKIVFGNFRFNFRLSK